MKVLITGATGLIGQEMVTSCLDRAIAVNYLTTKRDKLVNKENYNGFYWNPEMGEIDINCIKDVDVVINLTGASIAKRWTKSYKKEIIKSRVQSAQLLLNTLKNNEHSIKQIISASAIGIYPDSLVNYYEEDTNEIAQSFLGNVVSVWENAIDEFEFIGLKVCKIRIGLVLARNGGVLTQMVKPIKFGLGTTFGSGDQWQSWIHIDDLVNIFLYILDKRLIGIINGVALNPVTNREFTRILARVLNRPLFMPKIPRLFMRLILGDMHALLFSSQRVSSKKIDNLGFEFKYYQLQPALENILK